MSHPTGREIEYQKTVTVKDVEYKINLLSPSRAIKLGLKLVKLMGEPFAKMATAKSTSKDETEQKAMEMLPEAIKVLSQRLDEDEVLSLIKELINSVTVENKMINFETHFHGRMGALIRLTGKVLEVQLGDFLEEISLMMGEAD